MFVCWLTTIIRRPTARCKALIYCLIRCVRKQSSWRTRRTKPPQLAFVRGAVGDSSFISVYKPVYFGSNATMASGQLHGVLIQSFSIGTVVKAALAGFDNSSIQFVWRDLDPRQCQRVDHLSAACRYEQYRLARRRRAILLRAAELAI